MINLNSWLNNLRKAAQFDSESRSTYLNLALAPKFVIENFQALPSTEQAQGAERPPLSYPTILLVFEAKFSNPAGDSIIRLCSIFATETPETILIQANVGNESQALPIGTAEAHKSTTATTLADLQWSITTPLDNDFRTIWETFIDTFSRFLALLSAENVEIQEPGSTFSRKREKQRVMDFKRVETFHYRHLVIKPRASHRKESIESGPTVSAHWRRAHLRHYKAGIGHIKTTKTIAIAPVFINGEGFVDKDYII